MTAELVVAVGPGELRAGVFEDGEAVELAVERDERQSLVGAVYLGRVLRVLPALPGAFVDIGGDRPAFLPGARGAVEGAALMVQVRKDAHGDKAAELSAALELAARQIVWTPYRPGLALSRQLDPTRRAALSAAVSPLLKEGEGALLRSDADPGATAEIGREIETLRLAHAAIRRAARSAAAPARLDPVPEPIDRLIEGFGGRVERIILDDRALFARVKGRTAGPVALAGPTSPEIAALDDAFEAALDPIVELAEGGRLTIETGVAFTQIDVDLGAASTGREQAAEAIRRTNLAAARALVRELRRRNIGGAIVVDFISMEPRRHRLDVEAVLAAEAAEDPVGIQLHGWTRLDHFELTRRRLRPSLPDLLLESAGPRRAKTASTVALEVLRQFCHMPFAACGYVVRVSPDVAGALAGVLTRHLSAAEDRAGQRLGVTAEPGRSRESFDIGPA
jgi:Rne/Rng family ribonuclease